MRLLTLFKQVLQPSTAAADNHWWAESKNSVYQQLMTQVQQMPDKTIFHLYEQMTLTHQLIQWLGQYDKHADLAQFTQQLMQGSAYFISADTLIANTETDANPDVSNATLKQHAKQTYAKPLVYDVSSNVQSVAQSAAQSVSQPAKGMPTFTCWLHRSWQAERDIAKHILRISAEPVSALDMDTIIDTLDLTLNPQQRTAIQVANRSAFSIITGGPGTGKTYTVAALVLALHHHSQPATQRATSSQSTNPTKKPLTLALAAPTGKAAQRMQESLQHSIAASGIQMLLPDAKTVHRLLGIGMDGIAKYHQHNPLSEDIIIIDEASMLGAELTSQLLAAVKTGSRLILLGDAKQLAAVEAGSVLADLCAIERIAPMQVTLTQSRRFDKNSAVGQLATMIYQADAKMLNAKTLNAKTDTTSNMPFDSGYDDTPIRQLTDLSEQFATLTHLPAISPNMSANALASPPSNPSSATEQGIRGMTFIKRHYEPYMQYCLDFLNDNNSDANINHVNVAELFHMFNGFRILTAGHTGIYGDDTINERLMMWHKQQIKSALTTQMASQRTTKTNRIHLPANHAVWYHGRPIMIQKNTYTLGLYNGDVGICLYHADRGYEVYFEGRELPLPIGMLDEATLSTAYAITVHKSQGSEFEHVALAFDPSSQRLFSRELIYTGVTRAKTAVSLLMSDADFVKAVQTPTVRQTGLAWHFNHMANG